MGINLSKSSNIIEEDTCAICMENVKKDGKQTVMLNCNHFYHKPCIDIWLTTKNICPYCVQPVENYRPTILKPDTQLYVTTKKEEIYVVPITKNNNISQVYTCFHKFKIFWTHNNYNRLYESFFPLFAVFVIMVCFANAIYMPMTIKFINEKYDIVLNPEHYNTQTHHEIHTTVNYTDVNYTDVNYTDLNYTDVNYTDLNYTDVNYTDVNYTDVNYTDVNYTDVNYTDVNYTDVFDTNNSINNFTCVDINNDYHINYDTVFMNSNIDIAIQIIYTIFTFFMICSIHIKYKTVFFLVTYVPFIGWYTYTIKRYIQIFYYLNKMKDVTYCNGISDALYGFEIAGKIFLPLVTVFIVIYIVLLTRENIVRHMRVDTNTV